MLNQKLQQLFDEDYQWELLDNPEAASQFGIIIYINTNNIIYDIF